MDQVVLKTKITTYN